MLMAPRNCAAENSVEDEVVDTTRQRIFAAPDHGQVETDVLLPIASLILQPELSQRYIRHHPGRSLASAQPACSPT
jgi:hypothetical protein